MNFELSEEQRAFQATAGVSLRDDVGGAGLTRLDATVILDELAHFASLMGTPKK